ncbi:MAG: cupin-like domain-containing protein [Pseudomonadota bacterium]
MIFKSFSEQDRKLWGKHIVQLQHTLHENDLFSDETLMDLIDRYPRDQYNLVTMAKPGAPKSFWREGEKGNSSGEDVFKAIENGQLWINMRNTHIVDERYQKLIDTIFGELEGYMPDFKTFKHNLGILVSSPGAQVFYHCDIPGQSLWQVRGKKKVYVYPNTAPFLTEPDMEKIILGETEEEIHYEPWYDEHASVVELEPGQMLHWPLNAPHRVENLGMLNVSITTEHYTKDVTKAYAMRYANGILRSRVGMNPAASIDSPTVYPKMGIAAAFKYGGLQKKRAIQRMVDFRVSKDAPQGMEDIPAYAL